MKYKINVHLFMIALIAIVATALSVMIAYYEIFQNQVKNDLKKNVELLSSLEVFNSYPDCTARPVLPQGPHGHIGPHPHVEANNLRITWIAPDGSVLFDTGTDAALLSDHLNRPEIQKALLNGHAETIRVSSTLKMNTYYSAVRLENGTVLRVSTQAWTITRTFLVVTPIIILTACGILILCILIGSLLTRNLLNPIYKMAEDLNDGVKTEIYPELIPFADKIRNQRENILAAAQRQSDFTANVSHELKTPLTAISGYAELLENHMVDATQEESVIRKIRQNVVRLQELINGIVRLSEFDYPEIKQCFTLFNLYETASDCCSNLQIIAKRRNVALSCAGENVTLSADKNLMKELISNLVQNAVLYNNDGGFVNVEVGIQSGRPILKIQDNGIGIPPEEQERIFERFYRVDKSRSRETGGTGLGLAIVKHIVELHNATLNLESAIGKGTTITIMF